MPSFGFLKDEGVSPTVFLQQDLGKTYALGVANCDQFYISGSHGSGFLLKRIIVISSNYLLRGVKPAGWCGEKGGEINHRGHREHRGGKREIAAKERKERKGGEAPLAPIRNWEWEFAKRAKFAKNEEA